MPAPAPKTNVPDDKRTPLQRPKDKSTNIEATKYYIFNETGNIMIASTVDTSQPLSATVQKVFSEVAVFFAAMTRAITTTPNPNDNNNPYSLYNYDALLRVIGGSGLFVHVQEEDVMYSSTAWGVEFSKALIESLLGLATGSGEMAFASAMMASLGQEALRISGDNTTSESMVANIVFVCEYLLGMPIVSAIVVYADCKEHQQQIQAGPCFKEYTDTQEWRLHKDTYLFVTPDFIRDNAGVLREVETDPDYYQLVNWLQGLVTQKPRFFGLRSSDTDDDVADRALTVGVSYYIAGEFLGDTAGTLVFASGANTAAVQDWSSSKIQFTVSGAANQTPVNIQVLDAKGKKLVATPGVTVVATAAKPAPSDKPSSKGG